MGAESSNEAYNNFYRNAVKRMREGNKRKRERGSDVELRGPSQRRLEEIEKKLSFYYYILEGYRVGSDERSSKLDNIIDLQLEYSTLSKGRYYEPRK